MLKIISIISILTILILTGCSQPHKEPAKLAKGNVALKEGTYSYPHPAQWNSKHIEFYSKYKDQIHDGGQDCQRCHAENNLKATPKNVSCATQCHTPISKPTGETPTDAPIVVNEGKTCLECHASSINKAKSHYPAGAGLCSTCHIVDPKHLTEKTKATVTTNKSNQSCFTCHFNKDNNPFVHKAMSGSEESCVTCHNPHGSEQRYFVREKLETLCTSCHTSVVTAEHKSVHGVIKSDKYPRSCTSCHFPHSGPNEKLLIEKPDNTLCFTCHNQEINTKYASGVTRTIPNIKYKVTDAPSIHPATMMGENSCYSCHSPHASQFPTLLLMNFPASPYERYTPGDGAGKPNSYELCFMCHSPELLTKESETPATSFRNDTKLPNGKIKSMNLHWFHVADATGNMDKGQGRTCAVCHDAHGSDQTHIIKTSWKMKSGNKVKIEYTPTDTGGQCAKTCHDARVYKREN